MSEADYSQEFLERLHKVTRQRPKRVIDHILQHGYITTDELKEQYGYNHPPRAAQDVKDEGIGLVMERVAGPDGRKIARYSFAAEGETRPSMAGGRQAFPKSLKISLIEIQGAKCAICSGEFIARYLQIDHRIPYSVVGDTATNPQYPAGFMLLCGSCNRAKSWSCEHCENGTTHKDSEVCASCYWASPSEYSHIAMADIRRLDVIWQGDEVEVFDQIRGQAARLKLEVPAYVKVALKKRLEELDDKAPAT